MRKVILLFVGILLFSCGEKVVEKPENLIPKEKMVLILHDLAILNAAKSSARLELEKREIDVMEFLYREHKIDSAQFSQSDLYYASIPSEYQSIYEKVEALLEKKSTEIEDLSKKRKDSLKEVREKPQEEKITKVDTTKTDN